MATGFTLSGSGHWAAAGAEHHGHVFQGSLLDGKTLVLSLQMGEHLYGARLTSADGEHFAGTWALTGGGTGDATAALYTSRQGYFLFGTWHESQKIYYWWFTLNKGGVIPGEDGEVTGTGADLLFP
jgi:hypothetical protein